MSFNQYSVGIYLYIYMYISCTHCSISYFNMRLTRLRKHLNLNVLGLDLFFIFYKSKWLTTTGRPRALAIIKNYDVKHRATSVGEVYFLFHVAIGWFWFCLSLQSLFLSLFLSIFLFLSISPSLSSPSTYFTHESFAYYNHANCARPFYLMWSRQ